MLSANKSSRSLLGAVAVLFASVIFLGCDGGNKPTATTPAYPLNIVCTTSQVGDILEHVCGKHAKITTLMGAGVDPHLYKATPGDDKALNNADVVFFNGMNLEGRMTEMFVTLARKKPTFAVTEALQAAGDSRLREPPEFAGHYDPHIWHDASLWSECVTDAARQMEKFDPAHADEYRKNSEAYIKELKALHEEIKKTLAAIPKERRVLVTAHDAFGYFGKAYDIEVHGLQGISTVDEPTPASMQEVVDLLVNRKVKAVFVESSVAPRNVEALIEACAARDHKLTVGGELYSDAMGDPGTTSATYVGMLQHNVDTIVKALK